MGKKAISKLYYSSFVVGHGDVNIMKISFTDSNILTYIFQIISFYAAMTNVRAVIT